MGEPRYVVGTCTNCGALIRADCAPIDAQRDEAAASSVLDVERLARAMAAMQEQGYNPTTLEDQARVIAREYAALAPSPSAGDGLLAIVKRTATMGTCSQTHHEHIARDAQRALSEVDHGA